MNENKVRTNERYKICAINYFENTFQQSTNLIIKSINATPSFAFALCDQWKIQPIERVNVHRLHAKLSNLKQSLCLCDSTVNEI